MKNSNMATNELWFAAQLISEPVKGIGGNSVSNREHSHLQLYRIEEEDKSWYKVEAIKYHYVPCEWEKHDAWAPCIYDQFNDIITFLNYHDYIEYVVDEMTDDIIGFSIKENHLIDLYTFVHYMNNYKWEMPMILDISII